MKTTLLVVEELEDRCVPATYGNPWPDAAHLTFSFAPDGTRVGDDTSELFGKLDAVAPRTVWQAEALRALQAWLVNVNVNVGLVADGGQPFGSVGPAQGDARFGDLRLAATPMTGEVAGVGAPFDLDAGTWSGEMNLNSSANFGVGGAGRYDLYTILLHEFGHALGLAHRDDALSVMAGTYTGPKSGPNAGDIAALQAVYGARAPDRYEGGFSNDTFATAVRLRLLSDTDLSLTYVADADIGGEQDRDVYAFSTLLDTGGVVVQVKTAGLSLLTPKVSVFDSAGRLVSSAVDADPFGGDLVLRVDGVRPLSTYYVRVEGSGQSGFNAGGYQLKIAYIPFINYLLGTTTSLVNRLLDPVTELLATNDLHTNDSLATAQLLPLSLAEANSRFDYAFRGAISDWWDVDYYRVQAPAGAGALTAMVWGLPTPLLSTTLDGRVSVYDARGNALPADVLVNDGAMYTIQVRDIEPGMTYFVKVEDSPNAGRDLGKYFLGVDYSARSVEPTTFAAGTLTDASRQQFQTLDVTTSRLFHFILAAETPGYGDEAAVRMTVYDGSGTPVLTFVATNREPVSRNLFLKPGRYTVRLAGGTRNGTPLPRLDYQLLGDGLSDPTGPEPANPMDDGSGSGGYSWTGGNGGAVPTTDPYCDPYARV